MELNKIYCENCIDTMARMQDCFIDLTITSPPYDNLRKYHGFVFDWKITIKELFRVTKNGGVVVWIVMDQTINGSETGTSFKQALYAMECGFNLHDTMIYAKNNPVPLSHNRYEQQFEYMFIFSKGKPKTTNLLKEYCVTKGTRYNKKRTLYNIWFFTVGRGNNIKHNAPFPEDLAEKHILTWSNPGDIIYDPCMGSGTTGKMAYKNNRNYVGSEISKQNIKEAEQRIANSGTIKKIGINRY